MGRKLGGCVPPFLGGDWVPIEHKVAWAEAYLHTKCYLDPSSRLATVDMGRKLGSGSASFLGTGGAGSPSNIMWPGPKPMCVPSFILIHPTVGHNMPTLQTEQTDRQTGQRSDSIGRTVLQTIAQKLHIIETAISIPTKFCTMIKTTKTLFVVGLL